MKITENNGIITVFDDIETFKLLNHISTKIENTDLCTMVLKIDGFILYISDDSNLQITFHKNKNISDYFTNDIYEEIRKYMINSLFTDSTTRNKFEYKERKYEIIITPITFKRNNNKYLVVTIHDITKIEKIEEEFKSIERKLYDSNSVKNVFLSNISHELRTPMNSILGFCNILLDSDLANKDMIQSYLKSIYYNANYLSELLNNILDTSKLEDDKFEILYDNFNVSDLFEELNFLLSDVNYKKNGDFVKLIFNEDEKLKIVSDYLRLKQVLFNIISNAVKFTDDGYIKISVTANKKNITFKVEDTGIGISEDNKDKIFDRFWQADSSSKKKYGGTGLGLSVSKSLIELLGGNLWVDSSYGKGSTFYIEIPSTTLKKDSKILNKIEIDFSDKTVMIVDELPIQFSLLGIYLKYLNINILSAKNGDDAIRVFNENENNIDAVFIDSILSDMDSSNVAKRIKHINNNVKLISKAGTDIKKNKNYDYYLIKPINKEELLIVLNDIFKNK